MTAFNPNDVTKDVFSENIPLVLTSYQQFDGEQNKLVDKTSSLRENPVITLNPEDNFFRLQFALLAYTNTENIQYAYRVEGVDADWTYQRENSIRFSRLPYGHHILKVKGQSPNGQWSKQELIIQVMVLKPLFLQTWFLLMALGLLIGAVVLFFKIRTHQLEKQKLFLEDEVANRTETIRQQAEELKSLEKLKSRFFANVSHELRTPLTLILGPVNSILKRKKGESKEKELLKFAQRNGQQLQKLINEILDLSKLESGKIEVIEEAVHFHSYFIDQLAQFYSAAASDRQGFEVNFHADKSLHILLDKSKFEKIIHNFLSNAMKFTPPKGKITLTAKEYNEQLIVCVSDTGSGIHSDDLPYIFDRFYQSKQTEVKIEGGTGIGLSLVKELAELLGGKVWAESELGKGSAFYFQFPIIKQAVEVKSTQEGQTVEQENVVPEATELEHMSDAHTAMLSDKKKTLKNLHPYRRRQFRPTEVPSVSLIRLPCFGC